MACTDHRKQMGLAIQVEQKKRPFAEGLGSDAESGYDSHLALKIPPRSEAVGIVPQTIVLIVAFILP